MSKHGRDAREGLAESGAGEMRAGAVLVCQPGEAASTWQPMPANGHVEMMFAPDLVTMEQPLAFGTRTVPPGGHVRELAHQCSEEIVYVLHGRGRAVIDGVEHPMRPGTAFFLGRNRRRIFVNEGDENLVFTWLIVPDGPEDFFRRIGRPRRPGEPAPEPFARPAEPREIEREIAYMRSPANPGQPGHPSCAMRRA
ncbi:cupin domain-containing protein [Ancylobacter sp. Lp-2]|uniref:cupin domain-containing protein n=1 Tax=Ancylobacter sp. Lp-2 TaxID=2881339 RepID=UPI001E305925|nr:cupin domain-containing protein [Ancylobacter sp. Lp-2]MCB4770197.1 cupin domain-containing protein [Ancylobacter sp. Lp-2]